MKANSRKASSPPRNLPTDLRGLDLTQRRELAGQMDQAQRRWLPRLRGLVEPPLPEADFPAFLLETPAFATLKAGIGDGRSTQDLTLATADEVQHFVDAFRDYLRTDHEAEVFAPAIGRRG